MSRAMPTWRVWLMLMAAAGLVGAWLVPDEPAPTALVKPRRDEWKLPQLPRRTDQAGLAVAVMQAGYWGGAAADSSGRAAEPPPEDKRWRIAAIYGSAETRGALIVFEASDKPAQRLHVGDKLPSGQRIEAIGERDICIRIGKKQYRLGVERREE